MEQGFAADLFTVLHCPTALVVKTMDQPLALQQMTLLEEGAAVIDWIAIVRPSSKNRALAAGTRSLVATARTRYIRFGKIKIEASTFARTGQAPPRQDRTPSFSESLLAQYPSTSASQANYNNQGLQFNGGGWSDDYSHLQSHHSQQQQPHQHQVQQQLPQQRAQASQSPSSNSSTNNFDWSAYQFLQNMSGQHVPQHQQQQHQQHQQDQQQQHSFPSAMQTLPVGQVSPLDMSIQMPMHSPTTSMLHGQALSNTNTNNTNTNNTNTITFGHLPMMPNQMDNWPMSMQNLGGLGTAIETSTATGQFSPTPDPYAPSSEGFDVWLSSILSDSNGNGQ